MRTLKYTQKLLALVVLVFIIALQLEAQISVVTTFGDGVNGNDCYESFSNLVYDGTYLYGTTYLGGSHGNGTIFKVKPDGTGFSKLHDFDESDVANGANPQNTIVLSGSNLYGITQIGGAYDDGTIYKISTDGTGFAVLYSFNTGNNGLNPWGGLVMSGSVLYGTTYDGGVSSGEGVIFKFNTVGSVYTVLHTFAGTDGGYPVATLALSGTALYGTTSAGGTNNMGVVFTINTDGSGFGILHNFGDVVSDDGSAPEGELTLSGSILYGTTYFGGTSDFGVIYKINIDGTGYNKIFDFNDNSGQNPGFGSLLLINGYLWGMTRNGGTTNDGELFKTKTDGTFTKIYDFVRFDGDYNPLQYGANPENSLLLIGSTLYGTTLFGGVYDQGVLFGWTDETILPITLLNFNGKYITNKTFLTWTTASEINNDNFIVQKSTNGVDFENIMKIKGAGNSIQTKQYSCTDDNPYKGVSYYRLQQNDYDGKSSYSKIISVSNYDNPSIKIISSHNTNSVIIQNESGNNLNLFLYDMQGKLYKHSNVENGFTEINNLNHGIYILTLRNDKYNTSQKIIIN
ncbi:MAG: choice-of-anchor tandem repeat GloVer-containing protein [Bacteroidales bacterium]|jgi:uncharacterized repeat protein (TIGR03803 family)